jgi:tRNA threonylcarbamoyladenosine biosynthesis protein TsaB
LPRRTLCFDTSARDFSAALLDGEKLVAASASGSASDLRTGSRSLAPTIQQLLGQAGWKIGELERIVLPIGPGSFSGLRMGVVTAKVLGYSLGLPIFGLNTLAVIAFRAAIQGAVKPGDQIVALLDAQRGELFAQRFAIDSASLPIALEERRILPNTELEAAYPTEILTGSGLQLIARPAHRSPADEASVQRWQKLSSRLAPETIWPCDAATAGLLLERLGNQIQPLDHWSLIPDYGRPSAAEEKAIEREINR